MVDMMRVPLIRVEGKIKGTLWTDVVLLNGQINFDVPFGQRFGVDTIREVQLGIGTDIHDKLQNCITGIESYCIAEIIIKKMTYFSSMQSPLKTRIFLGDEIKEVSGADTDNPRKKSIKVKNYTGADALYRNRAKAAWLEFKSRGGTRTDFNKALGVAGSTSYGWTTETAGRQRTPRKPSDKARITRLARKLGVVEKKGRKYIDVTTIKEQVTYTVIPPNENLASILTRTDLYSREPAVASNARTPSEITRRLFGG